MTDDSNGSSKFCDFGDDVFGSMASDNDQSPTNSPTPGLLASTPTSSPPTLTVTYEKEKRRRSISWQAKLDRRRRKASSNTDDENTTNGEDSLEVPSPYNRQKRHSWWNILVPDNIKHR